MNEFTKEELQELKRCLKYMITGHVTPYSALTINMKKKIQSMIDNYCEHTRQMPNYNIQTQCADCLEIL